MEDNKRNTLRKLMITAPSSNTGKTLISTALIKLFKELDLEVMGAKTGPDYIDAEYLTYASGKKSENFDLFLMDEDLIRSKINKIAAKMMCFSSRESWDTLTVQETPLKQAALTFRRSLI